MKRRSWYWIAAAAVLIAVFIVVFAVNSGQKPAGEIPPPETAPTETTPAPAPVPEQPSTTAPEEVGDDAQELVSPFVEAEATGRNDPETPLELEDIASGDALEDLKLDAYEFAENGMVQVGTPKVVSATVEKLDADASPPSAVVRVCLDFTEVDVQTPDGESVKDRSAPQQVPSLLTLQAVEGRWLVTKRSFPSESTCE